ncbi:MAG TPA: aminopeptidase [bacterium]|uniref:M18 family aminopeptidase n=1 Tax=candidate division TA06 bacterium ADurb.Bin417 TaxID=1852828 RepID=A0A1V5MIQ6_UNCT6|nr:MAG: putative M18 family aminopeptidase 1 [candidate division TA06 bacterium ADurb.Bin417]HNQ34518.1 aminopeptidase [bacterium]HNS48036.1 aminopeptidase [bacterium]
MENGKLTYERTLVWDNLSEAEKKEVFAFAGAYRAFLSEVKTEREFIDRTVSMARARGFREPGGRRASDRVCLVNKNATVGLLVRGRRPFKDGFHLVAAHIDAPRLDLKPQPLVEDEGLALLKTHYYGGIKKYQWVTRSLSLHGVVALKNGECRKVTLGEAADEAVFTVTDLLPHLAKDQMERKMSEAVQAEALNLLIGSLPAEAKKADQKKAPGRVKEAILGRLRAKYGFTEEDFISADLQIVPAGPARDLGLDGSCILGYGQDDRICAYTALKAVLDLDEPEYTAVCLLFDREEIGSEGVGSAQSVFLRVFLAEASGLQGLELDRVCGRSYALSADVSAGLDPSYKDVSEPQNSPRLGYGTVMTKYTGWAGKYSASEASAEYVAYLRRLFEKHRVFWQTGELGKVDKGGGGTVAKYLARQNIETIDIGPALLSMHSPQEVSHKADLWSSYRSFLAFYRG